jgi:hypothetical protein
MFQLIVATTMLMMTELTWLITMSILPLNFTIDYLRFDSEETRASESQLVLKL